VNGRAFDPRGRYLTKTHRAAVMNRLLAAIALSATALAARADETDDLVVRQLTAVVRDPRLRMAQRVEAAKTIGKMGPRATAAVAELTAQLDRLRGAELEPLQEAVIGALGEIGSPARTSLPALARAADRTVDVEQSAKRSTGLILAASDTQDIDALARQLSSRDASMRLRAAKALGLLGPAARFAVPDLVAALADTDPDVRRASIVALRLIQPDVRPSDVVIRAIAVDLADPDPLARATAIRALVRLGVSASITVPQIEALLTDPDPDVRRAAADALLRLGR
jgi:HEAT repeat protein